MPSVGPLPVSTASSASLATGAAGTAGATYAATYAASAPGATVASAYGRCQCRRRARTATPDAQQRQ